MKNRRPLKIDIQLRAQVVSLRRAGKTVYEIGERLGLTRPTDLEAIRFICDALPRKYGLGELTTPGPAYRRAGGC
jgi:predicted transcriptional regulator